jgi:glycosyltransferase involved in cell wall biosynthesis
VTPEDRHRAVVARIPEGEIRPLWSVMIPTYDCADRLREALTSVLRQDPGAAQMQIEVVDDHSTKDAPGVLVEELAAGRVAFYSQPRNVGVAANLNTCIQRSRGHLVHILHGDDRVRDGFYRRMQQAFEAQPSIGAAFCRHVFIDRLGRQLSISSLEQPESGILANWLERLAQEQRIMTPSMVVRRTAYERLGGFDRRLVCAEDWEMWVRIAALYPVWYEIEPLAEYRMHDDSHTGRHLRTGEDMRYTARAVEMFAHYLPKDMAERVIPKARETYAFTALRNAEVLLRRRDGRGALAQVREALRLSRSHRVIAHAFALACRGVFERGRSRHRSALH